MKKVIQLLFVFSLLFNLTACASDWDREVDLTAEERSELMATIDLEKENIQKQINTRANGYAEAETYARVANAYIKLGEMKKAEKVYLDAIDTGLFASPLHHNLARLYEEVGEYEMAVDEYAILINDFGERSYWFDITWAHIRNEDYDSARKSFNTWQQTFNRTDEDIQKALKELQNKQNDKLAQQDQ